MHITQFTHLINILAILFVLVFSWIIAKQYPQAFFRKWLRGYAFTFIFVILPYFVSFDDPAGWKTTLAIALELVSVFLQTGIFLSTGFQIQDRAFPNKQVSWCFGGVFLVTMLAIQRGLPTSLAIVLPFLISLISWNYLGYLFLFRITFFKGYSRAFLGVPFILMGITPLGYPLLHPHLDWLGYLSATFLHLTIGVGMIVFLLERSREIQQAVNEKRISTLEDIDRQKDELLSMVSHELRNPLTIIQGYGEILERELTEEGEPQQNYVNHINRSTKQMRRIVDDILDFKNLTEGSFKYNFTNGELCTTIDSLLKRFEVRIRDAGLNLRVDLPHDPVYVCFDQERIEQVVGNILDNAIKFTPTGGTLFVTLSVQGEVVKVAVKDTGPGLPSGDMSRVFESFYQANTMGHKRNRGVGLGLAICKTIIEGHKGQIGVQSAPGDGSTFWFSIPYMTDEGLQD